MLTSIQDPEEFSSHWMPNIKDLELSPSVNISNKSNLRDQQNVERSFLYSSSLPSKSSFAENISIYNDVMSRNEWSPNVDPFDHSYPQRHLSDDFFDCNVNYKPHHSILNPNNNSSGFHGSRFENSIRKPIHSHHHPINNYEYYQIEDKNRSVMQLTSSFEDLDMDSGYQSLPPNGYICKLCLVQGHWLKNCNLYKERKQENIKTFGPLAMKPNLASFLATQQLNLPVRETAPPHGYVCRKCSIPGHWIQHCPVPKHPSPPETYICKICLVKGHWIYQCPQRIPKHQLYHPY